MQFFPGYLKNLSQCQGCSFTQVLLMGPLSFIGLLLWLSSCFQVSVMFSLPNSMLSNSTSSTIFCSFFRKKTYAHKPNPFILLWNIPINADPHLPGPLPSSYATLADCTLAHLLRNCRGAFRCCLINSDGPSIQFLLPGL